MKNAEKLLTAMEKAFTGHKIERGLREWGEESQQNS